MKRNSLQQYPQTILPDGYGREQDGNRGINIKWRSLPPAPNETLEMIFCTCSRECAVDLCPCIHNWMCIDK